MTKKGFDRVKQSKYNDGHYIIWNNNEAETEVIVKHGIVYVVNGFGDGCTGQNLEYFEDYCIRIIPKAKEC